LRTGNPRSAASRQLRQTWRTTTAAQATLQGRPSVIVTGLL